jgi:hypothetical protein
MAMDVDGGGGAPGRSPHTLVPTAGFGPFFRVDLGPAHLLVAPRFATSAILRVSDDFPDAEPPAGVDDNRFVNWWIGEVGLVLGVGVRPVSQVGIQLRYLPSVLNAPLKGGDEPDFDIAQTFALGVEIGL